MIKSRSGRAGGMLDDFADLSLIRYPTQPFQRRPLALRHIFTGYDAFYVAMAESSGMPLLTDDRKYAGAAGHTARIEPWG